MKDADFKERLQSLRRTDNFWNLLYLLRIYLYFAVVIGGAVWFDRYRAAMGWSWLWDVPVGCWPSSWSARDSTS